MTELPLASAVAYRAMQKEDIAAVHAIDEASFSLPWPRSAYEYELTKNQRSVCLVAELQTPAPPPSEAAFGGSAPAVGAPDMDTSSVVTSHVDTWHVARIIGMIVVWLVLDEAHIATIAVHPDYRRHGIAQQLMARGLAEAVRQGAALATLEVRAGNLGAQSLYRRFGFKVVGERPRYYRDNNEDAFIMTMDPLDLNGFH